MEAYRHIELIYFMEDDSRLVVRILEQALSLLQVTVHLGDTQLLRQTIGNPLRSVMAEELFTRLWSTFTGSCCQQEREGGYRLRAKAVIRRDDGAPVVIKMLGGLQLAMALEANHPNYASVWLEYNCVLSRGLCKLKVQKLSFDAMRQLLAAIGVTVSGTSSGFEQLNPVPPMLVPKHWDDADAVHAFRSKSGDVATSICLNSTRWEATIHLQFIEEPLVRAETITGPTAITLNAALRLLGDRVGVETVTTRTLKINNY